MKIIVLFLIVVFVIGLPPAFSQENDTAYTLSDCYELALKQSETIAIDAELIKEAEAHFIQSLGLLLPHVSFAATFGRRDYTHFNSDSFSKNPTREYAFVFSQTLFSGFKEFAGMAGSKDEQDQRINEKKRAEQLLFVDVCDAFFLLVEQKEDLEVLNNTREALLARVNELEQREGIGRSRQSEVVNAKAQLYSAEADIELAKSQEAVVRELLSFLIGKPVGEISYSKGTLPAIEGEDYYAGKAESRFDVKASKLAVDVAKKRTAIARSGFLPTVSLDSSYYTEHSAVLADPKWEGALRVNIPIFEGTETIGAVKAAVAQQRESELLFQRTERLAVQDIRDSYTQLQAWIRRSEALKKAFDAAEMNYRLQKEEYLVNLVNNLDVLQAIQMAEQAQRNYIHALYETKRLYWQLLVAAGENATEKLNESF